MCTTVQVGNGQLQLSICTDMSSLNEPTGSGGPSIRRHVAVLVGKAGCDHWTGLKQPYGCRFYSTSLQMLHALLAAQSSSRHVPRPGQD